MEDEPCDWLNTAPAIQDELFERVDRFRKTFVQVAGCEQITADRIQEIAAEAVRKLIRHHALVQPSQHRRLAYHVTRNVYAALHSFVYPHLVSVLKDHEERLRSAIASYASPKDVLDVVAGGGSGLALVDVRPVAEQLNNLDHLITPPEKVDCVNKGHGMLQKCVAESARAARRTEALEITGDDVLSLFILAVYHSAVKHPLAHVAHMEMYLQGAAWRAGAGDAEAAYATSALQAALQFFLEERRGGGGSAGRGSSEGHSGGKTTVFSSYLQTGAAGGMDEQDSERLPRRGGWG